MWGACCVCVAVGRQVAEQGKHIEKLLMTAQMRHVYAHCMCSPCSLAQLLLHSLSLHLHHLLRLLHTLHQVLHVKRVATTTATFTTLKGMGAQQMQTLG